MISIVIGEGGSGGALAIGVSDKLAMMRYSVFCCYLTRRVCCYFME
jgi:Acetyl-CoA carboxylase alpha subunit